MANTAKASEKKRAGRWPRAEAKEGANKARRAEDKRLAWMGPNVAGLFGVLCPQCREPFTVCGHDWDAE